MKKILFLFLLFGTLVFGETLVGKVVKVYDGDTLTMMVDGKKEKIRFYGIDAPEHNQPFGIESRDFVRRKVMDKKIKVEVVNTDRYGRKIGKIYYNGSHYLNLESVKGGYSWWYEYFARNEHKFESAEKNARRYRKGLWKDDNPINPYDWRKK
jgi:endonuclease YncB( thermonuclease family)